jgi:hypothetical protein
LARAGFNYANNTANPVWLTITNLAVLQDGSNPDIVSNTIGRTFEAKTPENFGYDLDGNQTSDGRWTCMALGNRHGTGGLR